MSGRLEGGEGHELGSSSEQLPELDVIKQQITDRIIEAREQVKGANRWLSKSRIEKEAKGWEKHAHAEVDKGVRSRTIQDILHLAYLYRNLENAQRNLGDSVHKGKLDILTKLEAAGREASTTTEGGEL